MTLSHNQIGMNTASLAGWSLPDALAHGREAGLGAIEVLGFAGARHSQGDLAGLHLDAASPEEADAVREAAAPYARRAVHAPFFDLPLVTHNRGVAALAEAQIGESVRLAAHIGGGPVIVHTNAKRGFDPAEYAGELRDALRRLGDAAGEAGCTIAVENLIDTVPATADLYCALVWNADHEAVGACIDTGHVLGFVEPRLRRTPEGAAVLSATLADMARTLGPKLRHVHVHDVRARDWRDHREVGTGVIDYRPFFEALRDVSYDGALSLEMEEPDRRGAVARSAARIRDLIDATQESP